MATIKLLEAGKPTANSHVYSKEMLKDVEQQLNDSITKGTNFVYFPDEDPTYHVGDLNHVVGTFNYPQVVGNTLIATVKINKSLPRTHQLRRSMPIGISSKTITGNVKDDKTEECDFIGLDFSHHSVVNPFISFGTKLAYKFKRIIGHLKSYLF